MPNPASFANLPRKNLIWTIIGLQVTMLLAALDQTIVATAMPRIIGDLNGFERYAWVTTAYLLTSTATLPIIGRLADMHGRKAMLLYAAVGFVVASVLCGMAGTLPPLFGDGMFQLIVFRGLQGIAGGAILSMVFTVLADLFPPSERGKYQGLFAAVFAVASVLGPALGGWITDNLSWRWVFYVNLPVGLVSLAVLYFSFPNIKPTVKVHNLDLGGVAAFMGWVTSLLLTLTWAPLEGLASTKVVCSIIATIVFFGLFVLSESKSVEPIIPISLLKDKVIAISCASLTLISICMFGAILFLPLYFQSVLGMSATQSGSLLTPMMLMMTVGSITSGQLISRMAHYKWVSLTGLTLVSIAMFLMSRMTTGTHQNEMIAYTLVFGGGLGLVMPFYTLISQNAVPHNMVGIATAMTQFFRSIGGTIGAAVFNAVLLIRYHEFFDKHSSGELPKQVLTVLANPLKLEHMKLELEKALVSLPNAANVQALLLENVKHALVYSLDAIFLVASILAAICLLVNLLLEERPLRREHHPPAAAPADAEVIL